MEDLKEGVCLWCGEEDVEYWDEEFPFCDDSCEAKYVEEQKYNAVDDDDVSARSNSIYSSLRREYYG